jgi:hypothetical protein
MPQPNEREFLVSVLKGDITAIAFCEMLFRISQTLDDLIDRDKPVSDDAIYMAFFEALIALPGNPFYRANELFLRPIMASALQDWRDSTILERQGDRHGRTLAFVLRDQLTSLVIQVAGIVGGVQWMHEISSDIRRHFHEDLLDDYIGEFKTGVGA